MFNNPDKISWLQVILFSLLPFGQLLARALYLKGSIDKLWLMLPMLQLPPFSIISMLLIKFGFVQDGKGTDPIDKIMWLPLIARIVTLFVLNSMEIDSPLIFILINLLINLLTNIIANITRRYYNCIAEGITIDSIGKAIIDSTIAYAISEATPIVISFIPYIGAAYQLLGSLTGSENITDGLFSNMGFAVAYILINMFNQDDINDFCSTPFTGYIIDKIAFFISIIIIVLINAYRLTIALSPGLISGILPF